MKKLLILPLLFAVFAIGTATVSAEEPENPMIVELDGFGFKGDLTWRMFEKGLTQAFEEEGLNYTLEFKKFPVKDYKGKPALEIRLNRWRTWHSEREINFWATYVSADDEDTKLDIISHKEVPFDVTRDQLERNLQGEAKEAGLKLIEKLKPHLPGTEVAKG